MSEDATPSVSFTQAIAICLAKYFDFKGRASRSEYWWFYLFTFLMGWGAIIIDPTQFLSGLVWLAFLFPILAAGARRLHDTGRSGWWLLLALTLIGLILLIIWLAMESPDTDNEYGSHPK